ncbi:MAG: Fic family protein, partial [Succinivibrio sp.]|nr:Fic family protein [Succinivibrio sp.]
IKNSNSLKDLLLVLASLHIQFEKIHPFPDGNGRVGRALIVYSCLQLKIPPVVIKLEDRTEYLSYMNNFDEKGLATYFEILSQKEIERMRLFKTSRDDAVIEINEDYKS